MTIRGQSVTHGERKNKLLDDWDLNDLDNDDDYDEPGEYISMSLVHGYLFFSRYLLSRENRNLRGAGFLPRDREDYRKL